MAGDGDAGDPTDDGREPRYRATFDPVEESSLLRAVSEGLAELLDEDPLSLEPPLATVAAWDALEELLTGHPGDDSPVHYVQFEYDPFVVAVGGDGEVRIYDRDD